MKQIFRGLVATLFLLGMAVAHAEPIGPNCTGGSCFGNIFTLNYSVVSSTEYIVTLTIDTTNYTGPTTDWIQSVAIKPASAILNTSTFAATTAPGTWSGSLGGLNASGCDGSGSGFICAQSSSNLALTNGSTYQWQFDIQVADSSKWLLGSFGASVKANYDPHQGQLTSEDITLQPGGPPLEIPEPHTLALMGLGLLALFAARRKQRR